jgi:hypothetical protein
MGNKDTTFTESEDRSPQPTHTAEERHLALTRDGEHDTNQWDDYPAPVIETDPSEQPTCERCGDPVPPDTTLCKICRPSPQAQRPPLPTIRLICPDCHGEDQTLFARKGTPAPSPLTDGKPAPNPIYLCNGCETHHYRDDLVIEVDES